MANWEKIVLATGTSTQYIKGDGTFATDTDSLPLTGGTVTGDVTIKSTGSNDDPATLALWSPDTSIADNDTIGTILAQGSDSGNSPPYLGAKIEFNADAVWDTGTTGYYPTRIDFFTESNSGTISTANPAVTIDSIQNTTFNGKLNLSKANGTGLTSYISIRDSGTSSVRSGLGLGTADSTLVLFVDKNNAIGSGSALVLQTGGTDALTINGSQNVAIGSSGSGYRLDVRGTGGTFFSQTTATSGSMARLRANNGSTSVLQINADGNIGIGIESPSAKLDINISSNARGYFSSNIGEVGSGNFALQAVDSSGANLKPLGFRAEDIRFATGSAERLRINSSGDTEIYGNIEQSINTGGGSLNVFRNTNTGVNAYNEHRIVMGANNVGLRLGSSYNYSNADWNNAWVYAVARDLKLASSNGKMDFYVNGSTSSNIALTIATDKKVGIGTTSPDGTLHIHTATAGTVTADTWVDDLVVENSGDGGISILTPSANQGAIAFGDPDDANRAQITYQHYTDKMTFKTNGVVGMAIDASQQVGIGTSSPSDLLDLQDGSNANTAPRIQFGSIDTWRPVQRFYKWAGSSNLFYAWRFRVDDDFQIQTGGSTATTIGGETYTTALTIEPNQTANFASWIQIKDNNTLFSSGSFGTLIQAPPTTETISFRDQNGNVGMTYDAGNKRLGIGLDNPSKPLHIYSSDDAPLRVQSTDAYSGIELRDSGSSSYPPFICGISDDLIIFGGNASIRPTILTLTSSNQRATFAGDVRLGVNKKIYASSNSTNSIEFYNGATGAMNFVSGTASYDYPIEFRQNDAQVMTIKSQRVGIGTQSPAQGQSTPISDIKLDVAGNQMLSDLSTTNTDQSKLFFFRSDGAVGSQGQVPSGLKIGAIEWTALTNADDNNSISSARIEAEASNVWNSASNRNADLIFSTVGSNTLTEAMRIDSDQNVTLGGTISGGSDGHNIRFDQAGSQLYFLQLTRSTTSLTTVGDVEIGGKIAKTGELYINPTTNLRLRGNVITFGNAGGTSEFARFDSSGKLGIGTSSPSSSAGVGKILHIAHTSHAGIVLQDTNSTAHEMYSADGHMYFYSQSLATNTIRIGKDGNVGIGTTNPRSKLHVAGGTASHDGDVYYYENVAFKDGSSSETGTLKITLPNLNSTTMTKFTIEGFNYSGDARGTSWTVKVGGYMYNNNNWYNYYAHLEGRPPFSSVRLAQDGSKNVILLGTTSTTWAYPKVVITEVLAGFNNGEDWGTGYSMSWITSETGIANIATPNIDYRMATNGDSIFSVVKTQDSSDTADYVKMYHDGTDGHLISNRGQLRLSSQSGIDALKIDSSGNVSLSNNLSLTNGSPVMYMSGSGGDHTRFGWTEGDPDVAYWRFYQNGGMTASITMDAFTENTAGGRIEFNSGSGEVAIASVDSGGVFLGKDAVGQNTTTELGGYGVLASNGSRYGNYGWLTFNAPTTNFTAGSRGWAITNGYQANKFAILKSGSASTEPSLTTNGEVSGSDEAPFVIDNAGNTTLNGTLTVNENALTLEEDIAGNASYVRMNYNMPNSTDDAYGTVGMQRTSSTTYLGMLISSDSRDGIRFNTANGTPVERMRIDSSGNVGINVDNPSKKLEVNGSYKLGSNAFINYNATYPYTINVENTAGVGNLTFQAGTGSTGFKSKIELQGGNTATGRSIIMTTADTDRMVILNNGNVGIGTTSPSQLLTISNSSDTNATKLAIVGGTKGFTIGKTFQGQSYGHIRPISSGQVMALRLMPNTADNDTYLELFGHDYETETTNFARGMLVLKQSDGNAFQMISDSNGSESAGNIEFIIENGSTPSVVIDTNGRMGIGNSAPDKTLVVQGSGAEVVIADTGTFPTLRFREGGATKGAIRTSGGDMHFYSGNASTSDLAMTISSTGNVVVNDRIGIGTQSPSYPGLHISNSTPYIALQDSDGTNQKIEILHSGATTYFTGRNGGSYGSFVFRGYNGSVYSTAVTIDSSQRVGIQEVSPTEALHVKGNIKASGELIGKTYVTFVHNFTDDMGTTAHTIPWSTANEGTNNAKTDTNFVAPYPMSLVKIIIRPKAIQTAGTIRVVLKKEDDGDSTNDTVAQATPSGNLASNTAKVVTASDFDNTPDVGILDKINIELSTSVDVNTSATDWFVTTVWTMDVN